ncbi:hypothetical protein SOPP22_02750 [Shewanella sp. OPT22]|nr:hypothetical protein SOPP22_02750 [Shewanella sp. OPT22]
MKTAALLLLVGLCSISSVSAIESSHSVLRTQQLKSIQLLKLQPTSQMYDWPAGCKVWNECISKWQVNR